MKQALIGVGSGLVAGALVLTLLILGPLSGESDQVAETPSSSASPAISESEVVPEETAEPEPTLEPCSVSELERDPGILQLQAEVRDLSGKVLFERSSNVSARAASVQKLLIAAAAIEAFGRDYRVVTRVYKDPANPGKLYFVGAGDPTLSRLTGNSQSVYRQAAKLETLAAQVVRSLQGGKVTEIVLDSSLYGGASGDYLSVWDQRGLTEGYMAPVSSLMVDGDRDNPAALSSARSSDPVQRAGTWFKRALGAPANAAVLTKGVAPNSAIEVARVSSAPLSEWLNYMLKVSDNTLAEAIGRLLSLEMNLDGSSGSVDQAIKSALAGSGLDLTGVRLDDASGLSRYNQVPPKLINDLLAMVVSDQRGYGLIREGLPVAGQSGSLSSRFTDLAGKVAAKTGWIRTGYSLAGVLDSSDSPLIFTVYNLGESVQASNRDAMDRLVAGFQACGLALSNR